MKTGDNKLTVSGFGISVDSTLAGSTLQHRRYCLPIDQCSRF